MSHSAKDILFNILNILVALAVIASGIMYAYALQWDFVGIVLAVYIIGFGILIFVMELKPPHVMKEAFGFFQWWAGRGLFYIFCGCLTVGTWWGDHSSYFIGIFPTVIGVIYIVLQFIKGLDQPKPLLH